MIGGPNVTDGVKHEQRGTRDSWRTGLVRLSAVVKGIGLHNWWLEEDTGQADHAGHQCKLESSIHRRLRP